jgi:glucose-1-phosphate thymidylyltransferase
MRLIVPMGGRGTRLRPLSHTTPKALLPVAGTPAIARTLAAFAEALPRPVREVVFVLSPPDRAGDVPERLTEACSAFGVEAAFAVQEEPLGTAHAVASAGDKLDGEVLTVWSDTLFRAERCAVLEGAGGGAADLVAWTMEVPDPRRFGVVVRDDSGRVTGLVEKPRDARFTETLIGAYYLRDGAALREQIGVMIGEGRTGAGGEHHLTDALDALVQAGAHVRTEAAEEWLDVGTVPAYLDAVARVLDREGPALPDLGEDVVLRPPVYVAPGATVRRATLGPYVAVETGATVEDASVKHAVLFREARVSESEIEGAVLGHRARLRGGSGSVLFGDDAQAGHELRAASPLAT